METTRREFAFLSGAVMLGLSGLPASAGATSFDPSTIPADSWSRRFKRAVQLNFNERDAEDFDVKEYEQLFKDLHADVAYITVSGIFAFYPSKVPGTVESRWLKGRDIFGECCKAAKDNGVRIMARLSPNMVHKSMVAKYPEWFRRDEKGEILANLETTSELLPICQFTSYFDDFLPNTIIELMERFPVDGIYMNGWPSADARPCYCAACRKIGNPTSQAYKIANQKRTEDLWARYAKIIADHRPDMIFSGNLGGRFKGASVDLSSLMKNASLFTADNQGRAGAGENAWDVVQQCRLGNALMKGRTMINIVGAYETTGTGWWRNVAGTPLQVRQRLCQSLAAGASLWYHWLGAHQGFKEDRRWQGLAKEFFAWEYANDKHFHNIESIANVGLVVSQHSNRLYKAPPHSESTDALEGMYEILTEARIPFDVVIDTDLTPENLRRYKVLVLPNVALLSDAQAVAIRRFVAGGGSLLTTFETGLYDETGKPRADFALADLYKMHKTGEVTGSIQQHVWLNDGQTMMVQRLEKPAVSHPVTAFIKDTTWIEGGANRVPFKAEGPLHLTNVGPYPQRSPEDVFPAQAYTSESTAVFRELKKSRLVYFGHDLDSTFKRTNAHDLMDLVTSALRWLVDGTAPFSVEGNGLVETLGWITEPGYAVHLLNYSYPNFKFGPQRHVLNAGPQTVRLKTLPSKPAKTVRLLQAGKEIPFVRTPDGIEFVIPELMQYEVAAIEV